MADEAIITRIRLILSEKAYDKVALFARLINAEQTTVNNYLIGKRKPSLEVCTKILAAFPDISAEWLLRGEGSMYKSDTERHVNHIDLSTGKVTGDGSTSVVGDNNAIASGAHSTIGASDDIIRQLLQQNQQLINIISKNTKQ